MGDIDEDIPWMLDQALEEAKNDDLEIMRKRRHIKMMVKLEIKVCEVNVDVDFLEDKKYQELIKQCNNFTIESSSYSA